MPTASQARSAGQTLSRRFSTLRAPELFLLAGLAVEAGNLCGATQWGDTLAAGLGFVLVAICLSLRGFWCLSSPAPQEFQAHDREGSQRLFSGRPKLALALLMLVHCGVSAVLCGKYSGETIDTFTFQRDAVVRLTQGADPFGGTHHNIYNAEDSKHFYGPGLVVGDQIMEGLQYPPLTVLWVLPGYFLGDIRYSYILAIVLSSALLYATSTGRRGWWLAAFLLLDPMTFYVEDRCFTEPLVLLLLSATAYAVVKKPRWMGVALGLFLASKQYNVVALPLAATMFTRLRRRDALRVAGVAVVMVALTVVPFVVWNPRAIWHDLVVFHMTQPFRGDAMSFAVPWHPLLHVGPFLLVVFLGWAVWRLRGVGGFVAAYGFAVLLFFAFGKQAFANYYFLIAHVFLLAAAVLTTHGQDALRAEAA